jgi:PleD family two-component response regulator
MSGGVIQIEAVSKFIAYEKLYQVADKLLYAAKAAGRDQVLFESIDQHDLAEHISRLDS